MPFDPTLPANNSPISSAELRSQLTSLKTLLDLHTAQIAALSTAVTARATSADLTNAINGTALNPSGVAPLSVGWDAPISEDNVQSIVNALNDLLSALQR